MRARTAGGAGRLSGALVGAVALALAASGCASSGPSEDEAEKQADTGAVGAYRSGLINLEEPTSDAHAGGSLSFGGYSEPTVLDPAQTIVAGSTGGNEMAAIYDVLMRWDEESGEVVPQLAESLEPDDDATTWTLGLREDVEFSDGTPLDADAVVASIERYLEAGGDDSVIWERNVTSTSATDDRTVVFELDEPWPTFEFVLTLGMGMIVADSSDEGKEFTPVGAGPYIFESRAPQEKTVLVANPDYWQGEPKVEELVFTYLGDPAVIYDSYASDAIDMAFISDAATVEQALEAETPGYLQMVSLGTMAAINAREGHPGSDVRVRQAIQLAIDPEVVSRRASQGAGVGSSDLFPESSRWHSEDHRGLPYDPERARDLVEEAKADGFDGKISFLSAGNAAGRDIAVAYKAFLDAVGFDTTIDVAASITDIITAVAVEGTYDMSTWGFSWREVGAFARMFSTSHSEGTQGVGVATSPELDGLIEDFQGAATPEEKSKVLNGIQDEWNELVPALIVGPKAELTLWQPEVHGVKTDSNTIVLFDQAWIG